MSYSSSCYHRTSMTLSSNKIQNGDILVPANSGPPGKWPLIRERECVCFSFSFCLQCSDTVG